MRPLLKRWATGFTAIIDGVCTVLTLGFWSPHLTERLLAHTQARFVYRLEMTPEAQGQLEAIGVALGKAENAIRSAEKAARSVFAFGVKGAVSDSLSPSEPS